MAITPDPPLTPEQAESLLRWRDAGILDRIGPDGRPEEIDPEESAALDRVIDEAEAKRQA